MSRKEKKSLIPYEKGNISEHGRIKLFETLAAIRKSSILSIIMHDEPLLSFHLLRIRHLIGGSKYKRISVVLHSSGGDINTFFQIVNMIRNHCDYMETIIPIFAKSAAILFLLASDEVMMSELSELGPLDTQVSEKDRCSTRSTSALSPLRALEELQRFSLNTFSKSVGLILERADASVEEAITHSMDFVAKLSVPLFSQLNPERIGEYSRALDIGRQYAERLLRRHTKWQDEDERNRILERLIYGYPSHRFVIDYTELGELGFDVRLPSEKEAAIMEELIQYLALESSETEIFLIDAPNRPG